MQAGQAKRLARREARRKPGIGMSDLLSDLTEKDQGHFVPHLKLVAVNRNFSTQFNGLGTGLVFGWFFDSFLSEEEEKVE